MLKWKKHFFLIPVSISAVFGITTTSIKSLASTPVYFSPEAPYNSGHITNELLKKNINQITPLNWYYITYKGKTGWVKKSDTLGIIDFSQTLKAKNDLLIRDLPNLKLSATQRIKPNNKQTFTILERNNSWLKVKSNHNNLVFWSEYNFFRSAQKKIHTALTLENALLMTNRHSNKVLSPLNAKTKVNIIKLYKKGASVRFGRLKGYINYEQLLLPTEFVNNVTLKNNEIFKIKSVKKNHFITENNKQIFFNEVKVFEFNRYVLNTGIYGSKLYSSPEVTSKIISSLPPTSSFNILKSKRTLWANSAIKKQGSLWWKIHHKITPLQQNDKYLLSHLIQKEIFDMASSPKISNLKFISANGVFRSIDGINFEEIPRFHKKNLPITFSKKGHVYIGQYRSIDHGENFEQYIHWPKIISALHKHNYQWKSVGIKQLQITKINIKTKKNIDTINLHLKHKNKRIILENSSINNIWIVKSSELI